MNNRRHVATFVCSHVFLGIRPVLLVSTEGDDWQFLCGGQQATSEVPHVVGIEHLIERDPSLQEVLDLPDEWEAERSTLDAPWVRSPRSTTRISCGNIVRRLRPELKPSRLDIEKVREGKFPLRVLLLR